MIIFWMQAASQVLLVACVLSWLPCLQSSTYLWDIRQVIKSKDNLFISPGSDDITAGILRKVSTIHHASLVMLYNKPMHSGHVIQQTNAL